MNSMLLTTLGRSRCLLTCAVLSGMFLLHADYSVADDWTQWRGPDRADRSAETGLLKSWPSDGPKKLWQFEEAGLGYAGFAVVNNRLYTMGLEDDTEFGLCIDVRNGKELWRTEIGDKYTNNWGNGPRSTPTVDGDRVYMMAARGNLVCLKTEDGSAVWDKEMEKLGGKIPQWGYSESPLVDGDLVFCTPGGKRGAIAAFDKKSGKKVWQTRGIDDAAHYSSMIAVDHNGTRQIIQLLVSRVVGVNAADGELLWEAPWNGAIAVIPTPIFVDGTVYVTSGYGVGCAAMKIGEGNQVEEIFKNKVMKNHHGGAIEVDGYVYGYSDKVGFVCQQLSDGKKIWNDKRIVKKGAVSYADGRFYFVQEGTGEVVLLDANPEGVKVAGRFTLSPQTKRRARMGRIWVHPVISDGKMYLRDQEYIYCFDIRAAS